jgi:cysteine synthase A
LIIDSVLDISVPDVFLDVSGLVPGLRSYLKIEALNVAGSIKLKPATQMIEDLEMRGVLYPGRRVIESSSGNLGIALSIVCAAKGYEFTCVTDPNATRDAIAVMRAYGARVVMIDQRDPQGGFLASRIEYITGRLRQEPELIWPNQYANPVNTDSHYRTTAREIHRQFPDVDVLFVGAGTTGTLTGCARYFAWHRPATRIIAVDVVGSTTFGTPAGKRHIPGLGTSRSPEISSLDNVADLVMVSERDAVATCMLIRDRYGILVGGSTGTVLSAAMGYADKIPAGSCVVTISADLGDRYVSTLYEPEWLAARGLAPGRPAPDDRPETATRPPALLART